MRKDVRTLIEICYVCETYLLRECINLATIWQQLGKEFARKMQCNKINWQQLRMAFTDKFEYKFTFLRR